MKRLIKKISSLKLYHGTSSESAQSILSNGLLSSNDTNNVSGGYTVMEDGVYLTEDKVTAYDYAWQAARFGDNNYPMVIEVDINPDEYELAIDEDSLTEEEFIEGAHELGYYNSYEEAEQDYRSQEFNNNLSEITKHVVDKYKYNWKDSLDTFGSLVVKGSILPDNFKKITLYKNKMTDESKEITDIDNVNKVIEEWSNETWELEY